MKFGFSQAPETAVLTCRHVLEGATIRRVTHDADGAWQFLCGAEGHTTGDGRVLGLGEAVRLDGSLRRVAGLPCGMCAERKGRWRPWVVLHRERYQA